MECEAEVSEGSSVEVSVDVDVCEAGVGGSGGEPLVLLRVFLLSRRCRDDMRVAPPKKGFCQVRGIAMRKKLCVMGILCALYLWGCLSKLKAYVRAFGDCVWVMEGVGRRTKERDRERGGGSCGVMVRMSGWKLQSFFSAIYTRRGVAGVEELGYSSFFKGTVRRWRRCDSKVIPKVHVSTSGVGVGV